MLVRGPNHRTSAGGNGNGYKNRAQVGPSAAPTIVSKPLVRPRLIRKRSSVGAPCSVRLPRVARKAEADSAIALLLFLLAPILWPILGVARPRQLEDGPPHVRFPGLLHALLR